MAALWSDAPFTLGAVIERSDTEEVDALPVLAPEPESRALAPRVATVPAVQTAAVAAGSFVAGAVVVGALGRRRRRSVAARAARRVGRGKRAAKELVEIVGSRSLLVDVHLLGSSSGRSR
jgi:hypothetical protein